MRGVLFRLRVFLHLRAEGFFDFFQLLRGFHPVFHVSASTAHVPDHRDLSKQRGPAGVDVVAAGVPAGLVRHPHNVPAAALGAASRVFHEGFSFPNGFLKEAELSCMPPGRREPFEEADEKLLLVSPKPNRGPLASRPQQTPAP